MLFGILCFANEGYYQNLFGIISGISFAISSALTINLLIKYKRMNIVEENDKIIELAFTVPFGFLVANKVEGILQIITFSLIVCMITAIYFYVFRPRYSKW